jgi:hypothetical protein
VDARRGLLGVAIGAALTSGSILGATAPSGRSTPHCSAAWHLVAAPAINHGQVNALAAASRSDVWAVGSINGAGTLVFHWDGHRWSRVAAPSPNGKGIGTELRDVAAISADDVWAVGLAGNSGLLIHWDGHGWHLVRAVAANDASLWGVSADASDDVWAVGANARGYLVLHWDGTLWHRFSVLSVPDATTPNSVTFAHLNTVLALSRKDVWLGGERPTGLNRAVVEHWDGTRWQFVKTPKVFGGVVALAGDRPTDIWAAVDSNDGVMRWDGHRWAFFPIAQIEQAADVAVVTPHNAWLVDPVKHWNGEHWSRVSGLAFDGAFNSIVAVSASEAWAAGQTFDPQKPALAHGTCLG